MDLLKNEGLISFEEVDPNVGVTFYNRKNVRKSSEQPSKHDGFLVEVCERKILVT